jgi:hypothetical protein
LNGRHTVRLHGHARQRQPKPKRKPHEQVEPTIRIRPALARFEAVQEARAEMRAAKFVGGKHIG